MSEAKLANQQPREVPGTEISEPDPKGAKIRSRTVKPGHLEVGEFTSGHIGAGSPFGHSNFPLPAKKLYYEPSAPVEQRILDDERH